MYVCFTCRWSPSIEVLKSSWDQHCPRGHSAVYVYVSSPKTPLRDDHKLWTLMERDHLDKSTVSSRRRPRRRRLRPGPLARWERDLLRR